MYIPSSPKEGEVDVSKFLSMTVSVYMSVPLWWSCKNECFDLCHSSLIFRMFCG